MPLRLTPKQQRFVSEYMVDLNASAAYQRAGYRARGNAAETNAARLLRNAQVKAAIEEARQRQQQRVEVRADDVLREYLRIAFSDPRKMYRSDGTLKSVLEMDDETVAALASVEVFEEFRGTGDDRSPVGHTRKVKRWDKLNALEKLGKHLGLFPDRLDLSGQVTIQTVAGIDEAQVLGQADGTG